MRIARLAHLELGLRRGARALLLHGVPDLVRDQALSGLGSRLVRAGREVNVLAYGVGMCADRVGSGGGRWLIMDAHAGEVRACGSFELAPRLGRQGLTRRRCRLGKRIVGARTRLLERGRGSGHLPERLLDERLLPRPTPPTPRFCSPTSPCSAYGR
jgi:hypothetical protein